MADVAISQQNFVGGELSPSMRGRYDLPVYATGLEKCLNFIIETSGAARFRTGTQFVNPTRRDAFGILIPFQFNDSQAYEMEFTPGYIRFYRNNGILTTGTTYPITGISKANPGVVTSASHGLANGDEVIISGVVGMTQVNGRNFVVASVATNTFQLTDNFGNNVNTSAYTTYGSGGTFVKILEITSPYQQADLLALKYTQNADTMYIVHPNYEPRKLTRSSATSWALALFTRTDDPFLSKKVITGASQANPCSILAVGHGYSTGQQIIIEAVVGMTQLNGRVYTITKVDADNFTLNGVNSTGYTAWSSAGYASSQDLLPGAVSFYQGRILYGYSDAYPESFWGSKALDASGNPQYDVMTTGTNAGDGFKFTLAPTTGKVDKIQDLAPTNLYLGIATFAGISKADGGATGDAITPTNINVTPAINIGVLQTIKPILLGSSLVFVDRTGLTLESLEYDIFYNAYNAIDKNLTNEHINNGGLLQMVYQVSRPKALWSTRIDGVLVGTTYLAKENVNGAHRHIVGGTSPKTLSVGVMPRADAFDQLWAINERVIGGVTRRYVEYFNDVPTIPELTDYYSADANVDADNLKWRYAMFEAQKQCIHLDAALSFDGSVLPTALGATMTPGAVSGNTVTFTASASIFTSADVGRQIWKRALNGRGTGRAKITGYTSATVVTCQILTAFDTVAVIPSTGWFLTSANILGLWHLEGETVQVVTDGGAHPDCVVSSGAVTLNYQASICHVGYGYYGLLKSMNLEAGGVNGPSQTKPKSVSRIGLRFINTLGARFGSDLYTMQEVYFRQADDLTNCPPPLFSGDQRLFFEDDTAIEKYLYIQQIKPLPCTVLMAVLFVETDNE